MTSSVPACCWLLVVMGYIFWYVVSEFTLPPEPAYTQELGLSTAAFMWPAKSHRQQQVLHDEGTGHLA